jgi:hypothetical protein
MLVAAGHAQVSYAIRSGGLIIETGGAFVGQL